MPTATSGPVPTKRTSSGGSTRKRQDDSRRQGLPGQAAQRPQRRLGPAGRRAVSSPIPFTSAPTGNAARLSRTGSDLLSLAGPQDADPRHRRHEASPTASSARRTARRSTSSDIGAGQTYAYDIQADGTLANKTAVLQAGLRRHDDRRPRERLPDRQGRDRLRQERASRSSTSPSTSLDRQRLLRRQGSADALHHREQRPLRDENDRQRRCAAMI